MGNRIISRDEVIRRINEFLVDMDGVTLEDFYNKLTPQTISYEGDDIFIEDRLLGKEKTNGKR